MSEPAGRCSERNRGAALALCLGMGNLAAWGWAWAAFHGDPALLGTALLAYAFGLRHAVDADHIAAIDNATRKLVELQRPALSTGLYFSLGHSSVVVLASVAIALTTAGLQTSLGWLQPIAGGLGGAVSALTLFALAAANCAVLFPMLRLLAGVRAGAALPEAQLATLLARRGFLGRLLRGLFRFVSKSWHMYPIGFLLGLGFDTATEIGVLAIAAAQGSHGLPLTAIIVFPVLFAAGMTLVDTLDTLLMAGAYRWASAEPRRKLYYNVAITLISVVAAVGVGAIQVAGLLAEPLGAAGGVFGWAARLGDHSAAIGSSIVALLALTWLVSLLVWRSRSAPR